LGSTGADAAHRQKFPPKNPPGDYRAIIPSDPSNGDFLRNQTTSRNDIKIKDSPIAFGERLSQKMDGGSRKFLRGIIGNKLIKFR
jgi:hypothetical protein